MRLKWVVVIVIAILVVAAGVATRGLGLSARRTAWPGEARLASLARAWTLPAEYRAMTNPVPASPEALRDATAHWADHCAVCHDSDGSGRTVVGRGLFPPAPDMRAAATQAQSDGALFYAIEQGIPFTGMPAWSTGTPGGERDSWALVRFIRRLPELTPDEIAAIERLSPKSPAALEQERQIEDFLRGGR
jgi:mono/diheme cytochrome c family protein